MRGTNNVMFDRNRAEPFSDDDTVVAQAFFNWSMHDETQLDNVDINAIEDSFGDSDEDFELA